MSASKISPSATALVILFGFLTAFDSLGIDMYLPAFASMEQVFELQPGSMSLSLSAFMLGLAVGQALCGPLGDHFGRKLPLTAGVGIFGVASAVAAAAPNFECLLLARFLQGLGGAACLVLPRTITTDLYPQKQAAFIFTILVQIQSVSPIVAPLLGIVLLEYMHWSGIFWLLTVCGISGMLLVLKIVPETKPQGLKNHAESSLRELLSCVRYWLMNASLMWLSALLFGYIAFANFIYVTLFQLDSYDFGLMFALNALGMIGCGGINILMLRRWTLRKTLFTGFTLLVCSSGLLTFSAAFASDCVLLLSGCLFLMVASLGFILGGMTSEAMFSVPTSLVGTGSAILGVTQYAAGALSGWLIGLLEPGSILPIASVMLVCALLSALTWFIGSNLRKPESRLGEPLEENVS